jgi:Tfp pilus assembly major pilin PilA
MFRKYIKILVVVAVISSVAAIAGGVVLYTRGSRHVTATSYKSYNNYKHSVV